MKNSANTTIALLERAELSRPLSERLWVNSILKRGGLLSNKRWHQKQVGQTQKKWIELLEGPILGFENCREKTNRVF